MNVLNKEQYTKNDILYDSFYVKFPDGKNTDTKIHYWMPYAMVED